MGRLRVHAVADARAARGGTFCGAERWAQEEPITSCSLDGAPPTGKATTAPRRHRLPGGLPSLPSLPHPLLSYHQPASPICTMNGLLFHERKKKKSETAALLESYQRAWEVFIRTIAGPKVCSRFKPRSHQLAGLRHTVISLSFANSSSERPVGSVLGFWLAKSQVLSPPRSHRRRSVRPKRLELQTRADQYLTRDQE